ncbi:lycopene cyclase domain-containing protein [Corynebacterium mendelii]|uniref:Lycopene cyclase domain-containing protein n=1 Tax=Corynebacterium mendelii TaxID=2765362 RepID=A0A939IXC8_9CORY|nr:lycopene cyclase domain-containing protein [Corynebacterium mendelii]MBN9644330.1 lycopene cyclase domain-containing protein [Corynebacterium mendelii]
MTYFLLSAPFVVVAGLLWWRARHRMAHQPAVTGLVIAALTVLTVIFDNLMIAVGLVGYAGEHNSGITIGLMPVEDLTYPLVAALVVTGFWPWKGTRR